MKQGKIIPLWNGGNYEEKITNIIYTFVLCSATYANAELLGGKWYSNPTFYAGSVTAPYSSAVTTGAQTWNSCFESSAPIYIEPASMGSATVAIVGSEYGNTGWNAMGEPGPNYLAAPYEYATMRLNYYYLNNYLNEGNKIRAIITHEWGHILGIAHHSSTTPKSLMYERGSGVYYDQWGIYSPTTYDESELNRLY